MEPQALEHTGYVCSAAWAREKPLPDQPCASDADQARARAAELTDAAAAASDSVVAANLTERAGKLSRAADATAGITVGAAATAWLRGLGAKGAENIRPAAPNVGRALRKMDLTAVNEARSDLRGTYVERT